MMYGIKSREMIDLEKQLLDEIASEKKFSFRKFIKLLELNAVARG